jgi:hypothetical protein
MNEMYRPTSGGRSSQESEEGKPLFPLGRLVATPGALVACEEAEASPLHYIGRHVRGDWGDLAQDDLHANEQALEHGSRLFSAYNLPTDARIWVITEADRSATTILTPLEY